MATSLILQKILDGSRERPVGGGCMGRLMRESTVVERSRFMAEPVSILGGAIVRRCRRTTPLLLLNDWLRDMLACFPPLLGRGNQRGTGLFLKKSMSTILCILLRLTG